jgi:amino acid transporter
MSVGSDKPSAGLKRRLGVVQSTALLFAGVGASGGVYSLWTFSYGTAGPAFFWAYPLLAAGVAVICLVWAELASHYPFAGTFYEWPRLLLGGHAGRRVGWWIGWLYLFGMTMTVTSIYPAIANAAITLFGWTSSTHLVTELSLVFLVLSFIVNAVGIDKLGSLGVLGVAGELVAVGVIVTLTLILGAHQTPAVLFQTGGQSFSAWLPGFLGAALFMPIWALYTFEGGGLLGEETKEASRNAPKAILTCLVATVLVAMYVIFAFIVSTKHPTAAMTAANPIQDNINAVLPNWCSKVFEFIVMEVLFLSGSAILTYASRQLYGMARAGELPASRMLTRSLPNGIPIGSLATVSLLSALPLVVSNDIAVLVGATSAEVYIVYVMMLGTVLVARFRGWPREPAPFSLGRKGKLVSAAALMVAAAVATDLLWPRDATNPVWHLGIRSAYWMAGIPALLGLVMWVLRPRAVREELIPDPVDDQLDTVAHRDPIVAERAT